MERLVGVHRHGLQPLTAQLAAAAAALLPAARVPAPPCGRPATDTGAARRGYTQLAFEEVVAGTSTPEHPKAPPSRTFYILHGLLGCGRNWRSWARRLVEGAAAQAGACGRAGGGPWRAVLVDLRCHGDSAHRPGLHPPHNMHTAAHDVARLIRHQLGSYPPGAVLGHSMGGKVALALLEQTIGTAGAAAGGPGAAAATAAAVAAAAPAHATCAPPRQLWVLDSQPGLVPAEQDASTGVARVLQTVNSVPLPIASRAELLRTLRAAGLSEALATWLASNLVPAATRHPALQAAADHGSGGHAKQAHGGAHEHHQPHHHQAHQHAAQHAAHHHPRPGEPLTWSFDIHGAAAMYMSYRTTSFWPLLERPPACTAVHLVQGGRSDRWPEPMQARLQRAAAAAAAAGAAAAGAAAGAAESGAAGASGLLAGGVRGGEGGTFAHHVLPKAGHWLHVDDPEGLLRLVLPRLAGL